MQPENEAKARSICDRIFYENNSFVAWHWDDRFNAIVSEVKIENVKQVVEALEKHLSSIDLRSLRINAIFSSSERPMNAFFILAK